VASSSSLPPHTSLRGGGCANTRARVTRERNYGAVRDVFWTRQVSETRARKHSRYCVGDVSTPRRVGPPLRDIAASFAVGRFATGTAVASLETCRSRSGNFPADAPTAIAYPLTTLAPAPDVTPDARAIPVARQQFALRLYVSWDDSVSSRDFKLPFHNFYSTFSCAQVTS